jgi:hypothetical protein
MGLGRCSTSWASTEPSRTFTSSRAWKAGIQRRLGNAVACWIRSARFHRQHPLPISMCEAYRYMVCLPEITAGSSKPCVPEITTYPRIISGAGDSLGGKVFATSVAVKSVSRSVLGLTRRGSLDTKPSVQGLGFTPRSQPIPSTRLSEGGRYGDKS